MPSTRRRRWLLTASAAAMAVFGLVYIAASPGDDRGEPTIEDPGFVAAANRRCAATIPRLRATREGSGGDGRGVLATARVVRRSADGLAELVAELESIEARPESTRELERWFQAWNRYIAAGRRYARALEDGDPMEFGRVDDESVAPLRAVARFARANRIDSCVP